jgi:enoyl-CoA hydratase
MTDYQAGYEQLRFDRHDDGVLLITLDNPAKYNAADEVMHAELSRVWRDVAADPEVRVGAAALREKRPPNFPSAR